MTLNEFQMNLTERREQLIKQREELEKAEKTAHEKIIAINAKLRKLETLSKHAEEIFQEESEDKRHPAAVAEGN